MKILNKIRTLFTDIQDLKRSQYDARNPNVLSGKILAEMNAKKGNINTIHEVEFKVFSQWGDDGIIQYLISKMNFPNNTFVEFGVENYTESNTRFLLMNNNWSGMVIDGSEKNISFIKNDPIYWQFDLFAKKAFINAENIESLIDESGFNEELGILSIDIDGNDYWVWKAINKYRPCIVIIEYNSIFGPAKPWTIPYDPNFRRGEHAKGKQYWGSSLLSLCDLAEEKGYDFIGCNLIGNNAYFIRKDKNSQLESLTCSKGYVEGKFRELITSSGPVSGTAKLLSLKGFDIYNTRTKATEKIS